MDKGVFSGQGALTQGEHTVSPHSLSARPLIMHGLRTTTSRSQHRDASVDELLPRLHLDARLSENLTKNTIPRAGRERACRPKSTLLHLNNPPDHRLPGQSGSVRGSTPEPGTGLSGTRYRSVWNPVQVCLELGTGLSGTWYRSVCQPLTSESRTSIGEDTMGVAPSRCWLLEVAVRNPCMMRGRADRLWSNSVGTVGLRHTDWGKYCYPC